MTNSIDPGPSLERLVRLGKAVADPGRLRILRALRGRELCVCQLTALLDLAPSTVSKHVTLLRDAGLVRDRRQGRWVYVSRGGEEDPVVGPLWGWIDSNLEEDPAIAADCCRLDGILSLPVTDVAARVVRGLARSSPEND